VVSSDWKAEVGHVASSEIQNKLYWLFDGKMAVLIAGTASEGHALLATLKQEINPGGMTEINILDRLTQAVLKHKAKLVNNEVQRRDNVTFEHFRTHRNEFGKDQWIATWGKITELDMGVQAIICTFLKKAPFMFSVDADGLVWREENFLTIGSGESIANSILCFRQQNEDYPLADTLYNVFEATMFARKSKTPGVGKIHAFSVLYPDKQKRLRGRGLKLMEEFFDKFGPSSVPNLKVSEECWEEYY
jgi:20S proteasome alpha/beta subunit